MRIYRDVPEGRVKSSLNIKQSLYEQMRELAYEMRISRNELLTTALIEFLQRQKKEKNNEKV